MYWAAKTAREAAASQFGTDERPKRERGRTLVALAQAECTTDVAEDPSDSARGPTDDRRSDRRRAADGSRRD